jgi:general nucleoside transport system permease protein
MDFIFSLPVVGVLAQLVVYLLQVMATNGPLIVTLSAPIALGALCGFMNERSGIVNIGIEGMMLVAAFTGWYVAAIVNGGNPSPAAGPMGITFPLLVGVLAAIAAGVLVSALHAWLAISVRADQIISGTIINIVALGVTGYLNLLISQNPPLTAGNLLPLSVPTGLATIPVVGWVLTTILEHGPITLTMLIMVVVLQVLLYRSRWGLRTRAVGEHPRAAETLGVDVIRLRYRNVLLGGVFAGLAGAWFTLDYGNGFQGGMTNGRGFIALAALIFGRWTPVGAFGAALLFGVADTLGIAIRLNPPTGDLGVYLAAVPAQVFSALPYIVTIIVLAGVVGRSTPPAADGQPYEREGAAS